MTPDEVADLYRRTGAQVLRRCRLLLRDAAEAEDVLQEVFVRVLKYGTSIQDEQVPLSWLYRTAERCCFDRLRRRTREPIAEEGSLAQLPAPPEGLPAEDGELIRRFFYHLPPKLMRVALFQYVDGLTQDRIAGETGWSRRTVGKKLNWLRKRARRLARTQSQGGAP
jgi:RNA polymerase sigma-70 factor (ECF subfamily)